MIDAAFRLEGFSDEDLLVSLKRHVGCSNRLTALVLAHLAEVEARGAHRLWACPTLLIYCVYELRLSEDEAQRRCRAARLARRFPILFEMLAEGSIHLTGILLLGPYLTEENHRELLARARFRRKREIEKLVAELAPWSELPAVVEPIGSGLAPWTKPRNTWARSVQSREGYVRELEFGDGPVQAPRAPAEWVAALEAAGSAPEGTDGSEGGPRQEAAFQAESEAPVPASESGGSGQGSARSVAVLPAVINAPARSVRYKIQFTADEAYVALLERARDLLQHRVPDRDLGKVQALAMAALVEQLERQKCGGPSRSAPVAAGPEAEPGTEPPAAPPATQEVPGAAPAARTAEPQCSHSERPQPPAASNTRHLSATLRRSVWERDGGRCTYVDSRGVRCRETGGLEYHHRHAFALGGERRQHCAPLSITQCAPCGAGLRARSHAMQETELGRTGATRQARHAWINLTPGHSCDGVGCWVSYNNDFGRRDLCAMGVWSASSAACPSGRFCFAPIGASQTPRPGRSPRNRTGSGARRRDQRCLSHWLRSICAGDLIVSPVWRKSRQDALREAARCSCSLASGRRRSKSSSSMVVACASSTNDWTAAHFEFLIRHIPARPASS
jgi:hypothetical protein